MWFLRADILIRMLVATAACAALFAAARGRAWGRFAPLGLLLVDLALIFYVSRRLAVFYAGYALVTYGFVLALGRIKRRRRAWFALLCIGCTAPFFYTRAAGFFDALPNVLAMVGIAYNMLKAVDALYYTYYTGEKIPPLTYANYLLFFPVITAGPIFRYRDFIRVLEGLGEISVPLVERSVKRLIRGMFKKVVVLALVTQATGYLTGLPGRWYVSAAVTALSYATLWLDMSGYADIAIALGGVMGIRVPENFKNPLNSPSLTMFWRNWHITLSDWIREHVFVVVAGKKLGRAQGALIGFTMMLFMCLWHEFSLAYLVDGVLLGAVLAAENLLGITTVNKRKVKRSYYILRCAVTTGIFAVNSLLLTLGPSGAIAVLRGYLSL